MDEQKEKQNAKKKRSALPIYAIGAVWLLYAKKLDSLRGIVSCAVVSLIVYAILRRLKNNPSRSRSVKKSSRLNCSQSSIGASAPSPISAV